MSLLSLQGFFIKIKKGIVPWQKKKKDKNDSAKS
jgi:hypothetical protein